jgi:hypothetical protein
MDLINKDALAIFMKATKFNFDKDVINSLIQLDSADVFSILYLNLLLMKNYQTGKLHIEEIIKSMEPIAKDSPELKALGAFLSYLNEKIKENEGYDKLNYLHSASSFIEWFSSNVKIKGK